MMDPVLEHPLEVQKRASTLVDLARQAVRNPDGHSVADLLTELSALADCTAELLNMPLSACGTRHLTAERTVRLVERFGWPASGDMLELISSSIDECGSAFNAIALSPPDDDLPF